MNMPDGSGEPNTKRRWWRRKRFVLLAVVLVPVMYVVSAGPATWLLVRGVLPPWGDRCLNFYYTPLRFWVVYKLPGSQILIQYVDWWADE